MSKHLKIKNSKNGYRIFSVEEVNKVTVLKKVWQKFQSQSSEGNPNADIDHYLTVLKYMNEAEKPFIIFVYKNDQPVSMLIGRIDTGKVIIRIGYKKIYSEKIRSLSILHGGIFIDDSIDTCRIIIDYLIDILKSQCVDVITFNFMPTSSLLYQGINTIPKFLCRDWCPEEQLHWTMGIPDSVELFYKRKSKNHKRNLRKYFNRLKKNTDGKVEIKSYFSIKDLPELFQQVEAIAKKTYQRGLGVGFKNDRLVRARMELASEREWLRSYVLLVGGRPAAYQLGFLYNGSYNAMGRGYDPFFKQYRVGTLLFVKIIEMLCCEKSAHTWDFGIGDAAHKRLYGDKCQSEAQIHIFSPTFKGLRLNILRTANGYAKKILINITQKFDVYKKIKKRWRERISPT